MESRPAEPAAPCPNCGRWYRMGDCNHRSEGRGGTLYGVCSRCAWERNQFDRMMEAAERRCNNS